MKNKQGGSTKESATDISEPDSEMKLWGPIIALVIAILVIPIIWLLIARWLGGSIVLTGDASGLLSTIGGVMGAIFTVGGLVIALVAILTQISLKDRIDRVTQKAIQKVIALSPAIEKQALAKAETMLEEKYDTVLRLAVEKQVNQQIRGHLLLLDAEAALKAYDWYIAEEKIDEALKLYSQVPCARSLLGRGLSEPVMVAFLREHGITDYNSQMNRSTGLFSVRPPLIPPPVSKAIDWLEDAVKHDDNPQGQVWVDLALLYGIRMDFEKMLNAINAVQDANPDVFHYLREPDYLMMLLYGCKGTPDQAHALV